MADRACPARHLSTEGELGYRIHSKFNFDRTLECALWSYDGCMKQYMIEYVCGHVQGHIIECVNNRDIWEMRRFMCRLHGRQTAYIHLATFHTHKYIFLHKPAL